MHDQAGYDVCCEWGERGMVHVASTCDVELAAQLNASACAPVLHEGAFIQSSR
jgi:hypothetical protein